MNCKKLVRLGAIPDADSIAAFASSLERAFVVAKWRWASHQNFRVLYYPKAEYIGHIITMLAESVGKNLGASNLTGGLCVVVEADGLALYVDPKLAPPVETIEILEREDGVKPHYGL